MASFFQPKCRTFLNVLGLVDFVDLNMTNNCRNCGVLLFEKNILCPNCIQELSEKEKKEKKEVKRKKNDKKKKWKKDWDKNDGNWVLENISFKNPYLGAVIYHFIIVLIILTIGNLFPSYILSDIAELYVDIFGKRIGEVGFKGMVSVFVITYYFYLLTYIYRLLFFIVKWFKTFNIRSNTNKKNKKNVTEELKKLKELLDLELITQEEFDKKSKELKKIILGD